MFKKLFYLAILLIPFFSCRRDDDEITYLSPEEQKIVDKGGIDLLLENYYLNEQGEVMACNNDCSSDKTKIPLKEIVKEIPKTEKRAYYAILEGKQGKGPFVNPKKDSMILINFGIAYFRAYKTPDNTNTKNKFSITPLGKIGNIYSGTEAVESPDFYYYSFYKYINENYPDGKYDLLNLNERNRIKKTYEDNNIYKRNVIHEFVEGIKNFRSREATINSPIEIQGIIIVPSANSKGLEYYLSLGSTVPKNCILVFTVDLLSIKKEKNDK